MEIKADDINEAIELLSVVKTLGIQDWKYDLLVETGIIEKDDPGFIRIETETMKQSKKNIDEELIKCYESNHHLRRGGDKVE